MKNNDFIYSEVVQTILFAETWNFLQFRRLFNINNLIFNEGV